MSDINKTGFLYLNKYPQDLTVKKYYKIGNKIDFYVNFNRQP